MGITIEELRQMRKEIEEARKKLDERERALEVVEQMILERGPQSEGDKLDVDSLGVTNEPRKSAADDFVRRGAVTPFRDQGDLRLRPIEKVLEQRGEVPNGNSPRARMARWPLKELIEQRGPVERTYKGTGSEPHRFKNCDSESGIRKRELTGVRRSGRPTASGTGGRPEIQPVLTGTKTEGGFMLLRTASTPRLGAPTFEPLIRLRVLVVSNALKLIT
ncbi:MAG: hypothetical protein U5O39_09930 [Gammaproteobacteria bacterium]|nr:hypothetical protein [Gammaproteobacteria bacterium]